MIVEAVRGGVLEESDLDRAVATVLQLVIRWQAMINLPKIDATVANHDLAHDVAVESMVLLKNGTVGKLAFKPRIQGIGSSQISPTRLEAAWPRLEDIGRKSGHRMEPWSAEYNEKGLTGQQRSDLGRFLEKQDKVLVFYRAHWT